MKKIDIARIPELQTSIGMFGSAKHKDVAGPMCLGVMMGIAILIRCA